MRAVVVTKFGGPEVLALAERPMPEPGRGEVRVRIRAAAVNRADLLQRLGRYPAPADAPSDVLGLEMAGEIDAVGPGCDEWQPGDRVFGLLGGGAYAEAAVTHARALARIPARLSFIEAAAAPEVFITAYDAMIVQAGLGPGETVLVTACGSGVGTAALQLARAIGARTIGTSRTASKLEQAARLGLDHGIVVEQGAGAGGAGAGAVGGGAAGAADAVTGAAGAAGAVTGAGGAVIGAPSGVGFAAQVGALTEARGADVIIELVGGSYVAEDLACVAPCGRIVLVGLLAGATAELDLSALLSKRAMLRGTVLRSRPLEEKIVAMQTFARHVVPLLANGRVVPVVDRVMPLEQAAQAHRYIASNEGFGKVVLEV